MSITEPLERDKQQVSQRLMTRKQFCEMAKISISTFHNLKRNGHGPVETHYPGTAVCRISIEAFHDWQKDMEKWSKSEEAKLENQRRLERATAAGKQAAKSPRHVSKRGKPKSKSVKA